MLLVELFTQQHILITIMTYALVEGIFEHHAAGYPEISGMYVLISSLLALDGSMLGLKRLLITVAQVMLKLSDLVG